MMQRSQELLHISKAIDYVYSELIKDTQNASNGLRQLDEARNDWKLAFAHAMSMTLK